MPYSFNTYVDPNSFDNDMTGTTEAPWAPGNPQGAVDGVAEGYVGLAGFAGGLSGLNGFFHVYGNDGLNGNGSGNPVPDIIDGDVAIPSDTTVMSPAFGPSTAQFTRRQPAPTILASR